MTPIPATGSAMRFRDLKERGIVATWPTLLDWIARRGFPPGRMLGPNTRAWFESEVYDWLASRPVAPKEVVVTEAHVSRRGRNKTPEATA
jgi:hypothetical protein